MALSIIDNRVEWQKDEPAKRRLRRWTINLNAALRLDGALHECNIKDISPGGARAVLDKPIDTHVGALVDILLPDFAEIASEVRHRDESTLGLMFLHNQEEEAELGRYLVMRRPQRLEPRKAVRLKAMVTPIKSQMSCSVTNISRLGAKLAMNDVSFLNVGDELRLSLEGFGDVEATIRRIDKGEVGVMFKKALVGKLPS